MNYALEECISAWDDAIGHNDSGLRRHGGSSRVTRTSRASVSRADDRWRQMEEDGKRVDPTFRAPAPKWIDLAARDGVPAERIIASAVEVKATFR